jgi:hypothetical protein
MEDALFRGNCEPTLDQILAEPIVKALMRRDGADEVAIRRLVAKATGRANPSPLSFARPPRASAATETKAQASIGVLAQAAAPAAWPRVFPSL